jgi:hypothetical protein
MSFRRFSWSSLTPSDVEGDELLVIPSSDSSSKITPEIKSSDSSNGPLDVPIDAPLDAPKNVCSSESSGAPLPTGTSEARFSLEGATELLSSLA